MNNSIPEQFILNEFNENCFCIYCNETRMRFMNHINKCTSLLEQYKITEDSKKAFDSCIPEVEHLIFVELALSVELDKYPEEQAKLIKEITGKEDKKLENAIYTLKYKLKQSDQKKFFYEIIKVFCENANPEDYYEDVIIEEQTEEEYTDEEYTDEEYTDEEKLVSEQVDDCKVSKKNFKRDAFCIHQFFKGYCSNDNCGFKHGDEDDYHWRDLWNIIWFEENNGYDPKKDVYYDEKGDRFVGYLIQKKFRPKVYRGNLWVYFKNGKIIHEWNPDDRFFWDEEKDEIIEGEIVMKQLDAQWRTEKTISQIENVRRQKQSNKKIC